MNNHCNYSWNNKEWGPSIVGHRFEPISSLSFDDWAEFLKSTSDLTRGVNFQVDNNTSHWFARTNTSSNKCLLDNTTVITPANSKTNYFFNDGIRCLDECTKNNKCEGVNYDYDNSRCYMLNSCKLVNDNKSHTIHFLKHENY